MKPLAAAALAACLATPANAAGCPQDRAIYAERDNGYELRFRPTEPWEGPANTLTVLDLIFPDGMTRIWGTVWIPNGTSHNRAQFYSGCELPGMEDTEPGSTEDELDACRVWNGIVLQLVDNDIDGLPWFDSPEPAQTILFPDLGPTIRYSGLVAGPGDEPHDVFTYKGCGQ